MLLKKEFSKNFLRTALYSRKSSLGIGLILPKIIIDMLKLKMCIGNKRKSRNTANTITAHEDIQYIEAGQNIIISENLIYRYLKST